MEKKILSQTFIDKICGGVYGKIIGVRLGIPFECSYSSKDLQHRYERIDSFPVKSRLTMPDDDSNGFVFFSKVFAKINHPEELTPEHAAYIILNAAWENRGMFWWDHSTESHGYYDRLHQESFRKPGQGSDNVGGQIFYDAVGLIFGGRPQEAARCAEILSRVMHAGEGRYGAMFLNACIARAFDSDDPEDIVKVGLSCIPTESEYARMVRTILQFYHKYPNDWKRCQRLIEDRYDNWSARGCASHIVMALLYGCGVFSYAMEICLLSGGDTDCNCGNLGAILGAMHGWQGIPKERWLDTINDSFFCSAALPYENDVSITEVAASLIRFCAKFRGADLPAYLKSKAEMGSLRFLFPFSYQGFSLYNRTLKLQGKPSDVGKKNMLVLSDASVMPTPSGCPNVLKLWIDKAKAGEIYRLYRFSSDGLKYKKRSVTEEPFPEKPRYPHLTKYEPTCCSRYLPGQQIRLSLFTKYNTCDMQIRLIALSTVIKKKHRSEPMTLKAWQWNTLEWTIPDIEGFAPDCLDIEIVPQKDTYFKDGYDGLDLYLDEIRIVGMPDIRFSPDPRMLVSSAHYPILSNFSVGIGDVYLANEAIRFYSGAPFPTLAMPQHQELAETKRMSSALYGCPLRNVRITCTMQVAPPPKAGKEPDWSVDPDGASMMIVAAKGAADHYAVGFYQEKAGIFRCTGIPGEYRDVNASSFAVDPYAKYQFVVTTYHGRMELQLLMNGKPLRTYEVSAKDLDGYMGFVSLINGITVYDFSVQPCVASSDAQ